MTYRNVKAMLKKTLLENLDGLTVHDLVFATNVEERYVRRALGKIDNVYIDRWHSAGHRKPAEAIYCIVKIPEDCPRPSRTTR
jgi:hypothetical protein